MPSSSNIKLCLATHNATCSVSMKILSFHTMCHTPCDLTVNAAESACGPQCYLPARITPGARQQTGMQGLSEYWWLAAALCVVFCTGGSLSPLVEEVPLAASQTWAPQPAGGCAAAPRRAVLTGGWQGLRAVPLCQPLCFAPFHFPPAAESLWWRGRHLASGGGWRGSRCRSAAQTAACGRRGKLWGPCSVY
jgi:hypothetical protein